MYPIETTLRSSVVGPTRVTAARPGVLAVALLDAAGTTSAGVA
jgi:hypothetical protein